jgi:hypothetical protein
LSLLAGSRTSKKSTYVCLLPTRFVMEWTTQFPIHNIRRFLGSHEGEIPRQEHNLNHLHLPSVAMRKRPVFGSESGEEIIQSRPAFILTPVVGKYKQQLRPGRTAALFPELVVVTYHLLRHRRPGITGAGRPPARRPVRSRPAPTARQPPSRTRRRRRHAAAKDPGKGPWRSRCHRPAVAPAAAKATLIATAATLRPPSRPQPARCRHRRGRRWRRGPRLGRLGRRRRCATRRTSTRT